MSAVFADISVSLDGYVAGPDQSLEHPLGEGGERLHEWAYSLAFFREMHGESGGETGPDDDVMLETFERPGAFVMGRNMFGGGPGPWDDDDPWEGWWGDEPPFRRPVFVVTHHAREPLHKEGGTTFTFVTEGVESAVAQAREAAGDRDVMVAGGAAAIQGSLAAGLLDELQLHVVPLLLGDGTRLFEPRGGEPVELKKTRTVDTPALTHLTYGVRPL